MSNHDNLTILKHSLLFQGLTPDELDEIDQRTLPTIRDFSKNEIIVAQGSTATQMGLIRKGTVLAIRYTIEGDAQVLRIYKPGDVICLDSFFSNFKESPVTLSCQRDCLIALIPFTKLFEKALISSHIKEKLLYNVAKILSDEHIKLINQVEVLSKRTLEERILTYLRIVREKRGHDTFDIYMNQTEFAQFLCVNRSVLSAELNYMRNEGFIDYNKSCYTILAPAKNKTQK